MRQLPPPRLQFDRTRVPAGIRSAPSQGASLAVGPQSTGYDPHRIIGGRISRGPHQSASAWSASGPRVDPRALARQQENTARIRGRMGAFMRAVAHKSLFDRAAPGGNPVGLLRDLPGARANPNSHRAIFGRMKTYKKRGTTCATRYEKVATWHTGDNSGKKAPI